MRHANLIHAVSRATGEDFDLISNRGFSLVEDESPLCDDDFDALIDDWYHIQAEQLTTPVQESAEHARYKQESDYRNGRMAVRPVRARSRRRVVTLK